MNLIVFFNGWGMEKDIISNVKIPLNYEFINVSYPYNFDIKILQKYKKIIFIGWSFGVYYLSKFISQNTEIKYDEVIAINGTPEIIGEYGIGEKVFDITLKNMSDENLEKFYKNMNFISDNIHKKNIISLIDELKFLRENYTPQKNFISKVIIGTKDRIIPYKNQKKYFEKNNIKIFELEIGHYPFEHFDSWEKIIEGV